MLGVVKLAQQHDRTTSGRKHLLDLAKERKRSFDLANNWQTEPSQFFFLKNLKCFAIR